MAVAARLWTVSGGRRADGKHGRARQTGQRFPEEVIAGLGAVRPKRPGSFGIFRQLSSQLG